MLIVHAPRLKSICLVFEHECDTLLGQLFEQSEEGGRMIWLSYELV